MNPAFAGNSNVSPAGMSASTTDNLYFGCGGRKECHRICQATFLIIAAAVCLEAPPPFDVACILSLLDEEQNCEDRCDKQNPCP